MRGIVAALLLCAGSAAFAAQFRAPPLYDAAALNIGINCQWQQRCMAQQQHAKSRALSYVKKAQPPVWRIHLCNRNASRGRNRVDWVGFDNCIRNASLKFRRTSQLRVMRRIITRA
jgi:hypothetical protein